MCVQSLCAHILQHQDTFKVMKFTLGTEVDMWRADVQVSLRNQQGVLVSQTTTETVDMLWEPSQPP